MSHGVEDFSTSGVIVQSGVTGAAITFFSDTIISMTPYLLVSVILILVDLYFGVKAALHRGETVRLSRAFRRTVGKMFEYLCWVTVSATLGVAFDASFIIWVILGFVMGNEVLSIITNWLESHNKRLVGFNPFKAVGEKIGVDLSDVHIEKKEDPEPERPKPQKRKSSARKCPDSIVEDIE